MEKEYLVYQKKEHHYPESYFHYMLGYCLPTISHGIQNLMKGVETEFVLQSYGEVLDEKLEELLLLLDIKFSFSTVDGTEKKIVLDKWDEFLSMVQFFKNASFILKGKLILKSLVTNHITISYLFNSKKFSNNIIATKKYVEDFLKLGTGIIDFLIIDRVPASQKYYKQLKIGHGYDYGSRRRGIEGIDKLQNFLESKSDSVKVYIPGNSNLVNQIAMFNSAKCVVSLRGAELANTMWMKPNSHVIIIDNFGGNGLNTNPSISFSKFLKIKFSVIKTFEKNYNNKRHLRITDALLVDINYKIENARAGQA